MSVHAVGQYLFEFWRGEPARFVQGAVQTFSRAGTTGTAAKLLGRRGESFTAELEAWFATFAASRVAMANYRNLIGFPPVVVVKDGINYFALYRTKFMIQDIQEIDCRANVRLLGPGINYAGGTSLVTRWTMTPILIT